MKRLNQAFLVIGVAALAWMIWRIGPAAIAAGIARSRWAVLLGSLCHLGSLLFDALALQYGAGPAARPLPFRRFVHAGICGHAVNQATPLGTLGEITKVSLLEEHLPRSAAVGAVLMNNFVMFFSNCLVLGAGTPVVALLLGVRGPLLAAILVASAVYAILAVGTVVVMIRGLGAWPFAVARWCRVRAERVARAEAWWRRLEASWKECARDRRRMFAAIGASICARLFNVVEVIAVLAFLGHSRLIQVSYLTFAGSQLVAWTTSFVPMQAGTAEGGNALLFRSLGLAAQDGVVLSLVLRLRRLIFIGLGLALLGRHAFARFRSGAAALPADTPAPQPSAPSSTSEG